MESASIEVGSRVKILRQDIAPLRHRKNRNGVVTSIDGGYVLVRPMWCHWETELYFGEIQAL